MVRPAEPVRAAGIAALLLLAFIVAVRGEENDFFGRETTGEAALTGIFYDLKQNQQLEPSGVDVHAYPGIIDKFIASGMDETILNQYYRSTKPLYTTQIFIPKMNASAAPKAFGVDNVVKPSRWLIHYKGQVVPPEDGNYRFVGFADDILIVLVNGKLVLNGSLQSGPKAFPLTKWKSSGGGIRAGDGALIAGDWVPLTTRKPVDLDIILGEHPGGVFYAFLLYQKQGDTYPMEGKNPILPLFQVAPYDGVLDQGPKGTKLSPGKIWKCLQ